MSVVDINYDDERANCTEFLLNYRDPHNDTPAPKYMAVLQQIADRKERTLKIDLDDVEAYFDGKPEAVFVQRCEGNAVRYISLFAEAADKVLAEHVPATDAAVQPDIWDVLAEQRLVNVAAAAEGNKPAALPPALLRRFDTYLVPRSATKLNSMRGISAAHIGHLVRLKGVITHVTDVKPLARVVVYTDHTTGNEVYQEVTGRSFTPLEANPEWQKSAKKKSLPPSLETRGSKFTRYQEARIQEAADEVPEGATPRTISVQFRGAITRTAKQGDEIILCGIFLPSPITGFRAMKAGLLTTTYIDAQQVTQLKASYSAHVLTPADAARLTALGSEGDVYGRLARSLAPEIYGHEDVKKALLLSMVGGSSRVLPDGMKLRGDIHVCLMGDPGVAKSQLLKHVSRICPRAVYTTGKGSSGVGLTAAVMRNQVTKELVLEGGALVLADKGVCCIDEFDKMDEADRTAIHEVMEQQTVSIAKAGIATTLNSRTTVMAAANPAWGRYDKRRTPAENIAMPAALLSRFDILWLMLDEADDALDKQLAAHIIAVHRHGSAPAPAAGLAPIPPTLLRAYIAQAKTYSPTIPDSLTEYIAAVYAEMRQLEAAAGADGASTYTTPRTLLSILRLAQAVAKLRFDTRVCQADVDEALRLMRGSKSSLLDKGEAGAGGRKEDPISLCHRLICEEARRMLTKQPGLPVVELPYTRLAGVIAKYPNITAEELRSCIAEYADLAVWTAVADVNGDPVVHIDAGDLMAAAF